MARLWNLQTVVFVAGQQPCVKLQTRDLSAEPFPEHGNQLRHDRLVAGLLDAGPDILGKPALENLFRNLELPRMSVCTTIPVIKNDDPLDVMPQKQCGFDVLDEDVLPIRAAGSERRPSEDELIVRYGGKEPRHRIENPVRVPVVDASEKQRHSVLPKYLGGISLKS